MQKGTWARLIGAVIVAVLLVILIAQNTTDVQVKLWFWTITGPLVILVVIIGVLGVALGILLGRTRFNKKPEA